MQYNIRISREGMPQDIDEARQGPELFGPFLSHEVASEALRQKGWHESEKDLWSKLSGVPGDRLIAKIEPIVSVEVRSTDQLW